MAKRTSQCRTFAHKRHDVIHLDNASHSRCDYHFIDSFSNLTKEIKPIKKEDFFNQVKIHTGYLRAYETLFKINACVQYLKQVGRFSNHSTSISLLINKIVTIDDLQYAASLKKIISLNKQEACLKKLSLAVRKNPKNRRLNSRNYKHKQTCSISKNVRKQ